MKNKYGYIAVALVLGMLAPALGFARDVDTSISIGWYSGDDHHDRGRDHGYYRHYRHYPHEYYVYRRVYSPSRRRYYRYYDVYPEKVYYYEAEKTVVTTNPDYLPITSIANMASQGVPDEVIISEIQRTRSTYKLTAEVITYLKQNGASDRVIDVMLMTGEKR